MFRPGGVYYSLLSRGEARTPFLDFEGADGGCLPSCYIDFHRAALAVRLICYNMCTKWKP